MALVGAALQVSQAALHPVGTLVNPRSKSRLMIKRRQFGNDSLQLLDEVIIVLTK